MFDTAEKSRVARPPTDRPELPQYSLRQILVLLFARWSAATHARLAARMLSPVRSQLGTDEDGSSTRVG